jgi:hypothetical protein
MTGATAKSNPRATKADERELKRLQRQDYWLRIARAKLLMDLIFVCAFISIQLAEGILTCEQLMIFLT